MSTFLETIDGVDCIQGLKLAKLLGIKNLTQFIGSNNIESVKGGNGRTLPWHVTVPGAMQMILRRDFGGNKIAANMFSRLDRLNDIDRVCMVLGLLEEFNPEILRRKPRRGPKNEAA